MTENGTAQGVSLRAAAEQLGVSKKTIRRYLERLELPKSYGKGPGRWAQILLEPAALDAIARAVQGTGSWTLPGVQGDTALDSPTQTASERAGIWTAKGQDAGQPGTALLPLDTLEQLGDVIRRAVAQGVQDGLAQASLAAPGRARASFASTRWGRVLVGAAYVAAIAGTVLVGVLTVGLAHRAGALPW